ncbi:MAG: type II secretion system protein [Myxococcales bacterium]|nr:type II secretion system protein [Myxococcales bacterium]USN49885.1 MAG: type II secretion system protein [Myxococcales bacterium]
MKKTKFCQYRNVKLGFTLLELMVVIVLLGFLIAIAIPTINSLSNTDLKNEIMRISGLFSEVYGRAAISGTTHRIVFDLDTQTYWVEKKEGEAGTITPVLGYEEIMKERQKMLLSDEEKEKIGTFLPNFKAVEDNLGEKYKIKDFIIYGAWTEQAEQSEQVIRQGTVSIYFFSGGYTQSAFVSIARKDDDVDNAMYVALSPLTGAVEINYGEPEPKQLLDEEKKAVGFDEG